MKSRAGALFVDHYYRISPSVADVISKSVLLRTVTRWCLMPIVGAAYLIVQYGPVSTTVVFLMMSLLALFVLKYGRFYRRKMG